MPLDVLTQGPCMPCCRVTFAPGGLDGARADEGHPVRGPKYVPPAKLQGLTTPPKTRFTKQDARELEELLSDADQIYAPSVSRLKRRHVFIPSVGPMSSLGLVLCTSLVAQELA